MENNCSSICICLCSVSLIALHSSYGARTCLSYNFVFAEWHSMKIMHLAHGPTVLTNPEHCRLVAECIVYAFQAMTQTINSFCPSEKYNYTQPCTLDIN